MSKDVIRTHCKQRYKGIENFLKRIAFNLGNTPSQTEVKIISCIPIDVSDLQQKIINLEKQLNEVKGGKMHDNETSCPTAINNYCRASTSRVACEELNIGQNICRSQKPSTKSFKQSSGNKSVPSIPRSGSCYCESKITCQRNTTACNPLIICEPQKEERKCNFFKKRKSPKSKKVKTHLVYYAQTSSTPFNETDKLKVLNDMAVKTSNDMSRSYLADMIRKQYKPKMLGGNISELSEFSSPVCRDSPQGCSKPCLYESDFCSCCREPFHNIDNQKQKTTFNNIFNDPSHSNITNSSKTYYDSKLYDLIPVKEKPIKLKKDSEVPVKPKPEVEVICCPKNIRPIPRFHPYIVNYHTVSPIKNNYMKNVPRNLKRRDTLYEKVVSKRKKINLQMDTLSSKSCCVEFGKVYMKKMRNKSVPVTILETPGPPRPKIKVTKAIQITGPMHKNAGCLTISINNTECQTINDNAEVNKTEDKTEATLNQIRSILQSVLTEVKTNKSKSTSDDKPKKDAVVQKGASQSHLQGSSFLNSFTYSPYNMNPYFATTSQPLNSNHLYCPRDPLKCLQNFPLIIQPGRPLCNSCCRNSSHINRKNTKQATTTSTNTDNLKEERNKETEKLIKEIYKSMALTANLPAKDASYSENEYLKSFYDSGDEPIEITEVEKTNNVAKAISEVFLNNRVHTDTSDGYDNKFTSNSVSTKSQYASTDTVTKRERLMQYNRKDSHSVSTAIEDRTPIEEELEMYTETESESSSSDVQSEAASEPVKEIRVNQKKEKKSLFSKMFQSMFKSKENSRKADTKPDIETESTSDSDDYQTIYSQKVTKPQYRTRVIKMPKIKTHSKISNSKHMHRESSPNRYRRVPYMEQENRRHWNENLIFEKHNEKYSSEIPVSKDTPQKPVYYQNYEARAAVVTPEGPECESENEDRVTTYIQKDQRDVPELKGNYRAKDLKEGKGLAWLKKHKMGIRCGEQWKKMIIEG